MKKTEIKTEITRVSRQRFDGLRQLKILVKIGYKTSKFIELKRFHVKVRDKLNNQYLISDKQYKRIKEQPPNEERLYLFKVENEIKRIVLELVSTGKEFGVKEINNRLYTIQREDAVDTKVKSWNQFLNTIGSEAEDQDYKKGEIERIEKAIDEESKLNEVLTDEDIDNIKNAVGISMQIEREQEYVKSLSWEERYAKGKYDSKDIIEVFGFCWTNNPKNGDPYISSGYKALIFHLADYFINGNNVSKSVTDFNLKWVEKFLTFKIKKGYPTTHLRGYNPFTILDHRDSLAKSPREEYKAATFIKLVKFLNQYIDILQKEGKLSPNIINTKHIEAKDYLSRKVNTDQFTKIEFTLEYEEIEQLLNAKLDDQKMQLATDMYIIQMYAGGLRPIELYKGNIRFTENYVSFYRSKSKRISKNPILPEVKNVLEKYPDGLPTFLKIDDYRKNLKKVAQHFKWERIIEEPNTSLNPDSDTIIHELREVFAPFTARKTFINYLANLGLPEELIIQFTEHTNVQILRHYKRKLNLTQKKKIIEDLLKAFSENV